MANEEVSPLGGATTKTTKPKQPTAPTEKIAFEVSVPSHETAVACEVCGHLNPQNAGICAMCSNYLFH